MSIGRQITHIRTLAGISQTQLARMVCCAQSQICKIEGGGGTSLAQLQNIADALGESLIIHPVFQAEE